MADIVISDQEVQSIINEAGLPASAAAAGAAAAPANSDLCAAIDLVVAFLGSLNPSNTLLKIAIQLIIALLNAYKAKNCGGS
jgi:hypothetical protein